MSCTEYTVQKLIAWLGLEHNEPTMYMHIRAYEHQSTHTVCISVDVCKIHSSPVPAWRWMKILLTFWLWSSSLRNEEDRSITIKKDGRIFIHLQAGTRELRVLHASSSWPLLHYTHVHVCYITSHVLYLPTQRESTQLKCNGNCSCNVHT